MRRSFFRSALAAAALLSAACGRVADVLDPGHASSAARPAHVAVAARIALGTQAATTTTLRARASYLRADGTLVPIADQQVTLQDVATQQVPLSIDLATCLSDAARRGASDTDATCDVMIELSLLADTRVVDQTTIGPLRLRPGATTNADPVSLFEVGTVTVNAPSGPVPAGGSVRLVVGATTALGATVTASTGTAATGHSVTWTSDAPSIARVDANGNVTAVATGHAHVTATAGVRSAVVDVVVVPPSSPVTVNAIASGGSGSVRSTPAGIDCRIVAGKTQGTCTFAFQSDAQVTLTATADAGSVAGAFTGDCTGTTCTVGADVARTASIGFSALRQVTVSANGSGAGTVTSTPAGITCQIQNGATTGTCTASFRDSTTVTLTAAPSGSQSFGSWGGDCASATTHTCTLSLAGASRSATAQFLPPSLLTLALSGSGGGFVSIVSGTTSLGACTYANGQQSGSCSAGFITGTTVTLVASPDASSNFGGWTGACAGSATTCDVTMSQARSVGAVFTSRAPVVTVQAAPASTGTGTITSSGGLACTVNGTSTTGTCAVTVPTGGTMTLTAAAGTNSAFSAWGGACANATGSTCTLTPTTSAAVTAQFDRTAELDVELEGYYESGQATPVVDGVARGACVVRADTTYAQRSCFYTVRVGATVVLTASPVNGFSGWDAPCDGARSTVAQCVFTFTGATRATGSFGYSGGYQRAPLSTRAPAAPNGDVTSDAAVRQPVRASGFPSSPSRATRGASSRG